jgi:hypothetical protein
MNLVANAVLTRDIAAGEPPTLGSVEHVVLFGKLAFFTALGIPDNGFFDTPIRDNPEDPAAGGMPLDLGVANAGAQIISFTLSGQTANPAQSLVRRAGRAGETGNIPALRGHRSYRGVDVAKGG